MLRPDHGVFDLRDTVFTDQTAFRLTGGWEFYWDRFVYSRDFRKKTVPRYDCIGKVPAYWHTYSTENKEYGNTGYATYRLRILLPEGYAAPLAFDVPVFDASFRLYIDGRFMGGNGEPGTSEKNSRAGYAPFTIEYFPQSDTLELIVQVSNFQHRRGGFWKVMKMGSPEKIRSQNEQFRLISSITVGMLATFMLIFFCFFILFREARNMLFFSLTLAGIFLRLVSTGTYPVLVLTDLSWNWLIRLEYLGTFLALLFGMWYFNSLFPRRTGRYLAKINTVLCSLCMLAVLVLRVRFFAYTLFYMQAAGLVLLVYYTVIAGIAAAGKEKKQRLALFSFIGLVILLSALANDILVANSRSPFQDTYLIHFAVQLFVFIQAVLLIRNWIVVFKERESLHTEVEYINRNLEQLVSYRTNELEDKNSQIVNQNEDLRSAISMRDRVFSIISHDLRSPISGLTQLFELFDEKLSKEEQQKVIRSSRSLINAARDLIDNLLYWGRSQMDKIQHMPETTDVQPLITGTISLFREIAARKAISLKYEPGRKNMGYFDPDLVRIVLRNLISNAVKFNSEGGSVTVSSSTSEPDMGNELVIRVTDSGSGMDREKVAAILNGEHVESTYGTASEKGVGLGLGLVRELVSTSNGKLEIESRLGEGTVITVRMPASVSRQA